MQSGEKSLKSNYKPRSYEVAIGGPNKREWQESMKEEFDALIQNETWELVLLPENSKKIDYKWVYRLKYGSNGEVIRYKSILVAKGFEQVKGLNYNDTNAPVAIHNLLRNIIAIAATKNLSLHHFDFKCVYLNGKLDDEVIFMTIPKGFYTKIDTTKYALKLKRCIYGLKQSGKNWNEVLDKALIECELKRCRANRYVYMNRNNERMALIAICIDDIVIATDNEPFIKKMKMKIESKFEMKDLGQLKSFLAIRIENNASGITMDQESLIAQTLKNYNMENSRGV